MAAGLAAGLLLTLTGSAGQAQRRGSEPLGPGPWLFETIDQPYRVVAITRELSHPWGLAFLPDGTMLVTERPGRIRVVRNGVLEPEPVTGLPPIHARGLAGLMDIALHPRFSENRLLYVTYSKDGPQGATTAVARGRLDGRALTDVRDVFVANAWRDGNDFGDGRYGSRIAFDRDGRLYVSVGERDLWEKAQDPGSHLGKLLRLNDDGTVPADNPFVGREGYLPEIYSIGHRNQQGMAFHPVTGELWATEHGPLGGDELNVVLPGRNYGWPLVTYGINYNGEKISEIPWRADLEPPLLYWVPSIGASGLAFYTGDRFPAWKGNVFSGGMMFARTSQTGRLERLIFNDRGLPIRRESLLIELHQRIRDVRQGPDGLLYVLTDEDQGALLRLEPVD
jgi:glucose/arabinose dehydrogenase